MDEFVVEVIEARAISSSDGESLPNSYCRIKSNFNNQKYKTKTITKTFAPKWNETFTFYPDDKPPTGAITVQIFDKNTILKDVSLGELAFDVSQYANGASHDQWIGLKNEPKKKGAVRGEIHLKVTFRAVSLGASSGQVETHSSVASSGALEDKYTVKEQLGKGAFAVVHKAVEKATNTEYAVKSINKLQLKAKDVQMLAREIKIMKKLEHPNIVQLYDVFETEEQLHLVMEVMVGGELFDQIIKRGHYAEEDARQVVYQILIAVEYMHSHGVVHRDLKPENLLCTGDGKKLKVADFGMSKDVAMGSLQTSVGSPNYIAPEILLKTLYGPECDMWSIGVITYVLLCGCIPFYGRNQQDMFQKIVSASFKFEPAEEWLLVSDQAEDFITQLLVANPLNRLTATQALAHPWLQNETSQTNLKSVSRNLSKTKSLVLTKE